MTTPEKCPFCGSLKDATDMWEASHYECGSWLGGKRSDVDYKPTPFCRALERAQKAEEQINELLLLVMPLNSEPDEDGVIHKSTDYPLSWKCEQIRTAIYDMTSEISNLQRTIGDCEAQWHSKH